MMIVSPVIYRRIIVALFYSICRVVEAYLLTVEYHGKKAAGGNNCISLILFCYFNLKYLFYR